MTWKDIIQAAAASNLGLIALAMLILSGGVTFLFSRRDHWAIRLSVFVMMIIGVGLFSYATFQETKALATSSDDQCGNVNASVINPLAGNGGAYWCRYYAALPNLKAQGSQGRCSSYIGTFGDMSQRALVEAAIVDAKASRKQEAIEKIQACQCHNEAHFKRVGLDAEQLYCWLRKQ
jgi:hypothetical protein